MSITIFRGLPGSGKSRRLIEIVNSERSTGRATLTLLPADAEWVAGYDAYRQNRTLGSRDPAGPTCPIDQMLDTSRLEQALAPLSPGTLVAVEEAQMFGSSAAQLWKESAEKGIDFILVSPSADQLAGLTGADYSTINFAIRCEICGRRDAVTAVMDPTTDHLLSVCGTCFEDEALRGRQRTVQMLIDELPHRGERSLYQPVEMAECKDWPVSRPDSEARADLVEQLMIELGILNGASTAHPTYLDIGCSTGYFCSWFQQKGVYSKGIDAAPDNIVIAKLLDTYVRRQHRPNKKFVTYTSGDAYHYLRDTPDERFDAVSAFSVIQWIMSQRGVDAALDCFDWTFAKTRRLCVIEMGYSSQDNYGVLLPITVDRSWVRSVMDRGRFDEVRVIEAGTAGIMRDLFIGVRNPIPGPA